MHPAEPESRPDLGDFLDETVHRPERRVVGLVRPPAAQLIVENYLAPVAERLQRLQVVVGKARPAVQAQQRGAAFAD